MSNPNNDSFEVSATWADLHRDAAQRQESANEALLEERIAAATAAGKEQFDADKLLGLYYPNDWSGDEADVLRRAQSFRAAYYSSDATTLEGWVIEREAIEAQGDSQTDLLGGCLDAAINNNCKLIQSARQQANKVLG